MLDIRILSKEGHTEKVKLRPSEETIHTKERELIVYSDEEFDHKRKEYYHEEKDVVHKVLGHPENLPKDTPLS